MAKYDSIGLKYNNTRKADPHLAELLFNYLNPAPDGIYLDIGCGTGNYSNTLHLKGVELIGIDPSEVMLEKAKLLNPEVDWRIGTSENTGLDSMSIDGIVGTLTIHHWPNLEASFQELYRVLKPKGRIVLFSSTPEQMKSYWLNHYFPTMLESSMQQMPSLSKVEAAMKIAGFKNIKSNLYSVHEGLEDLFLYAGKHNPSLYLKPEVRRGISSFSKLANQEEVNQGLEKLRTDISSGTIQEIIKEYQNEAGDYLHIISEK